MTAEVRFDNRRYAELLSETLPKRIETEEETERALAVLAVSFNRDDPAVEEEALFFRLPAHDPQFDKAGFLDLGVGKDGGRVGQQLQAFVLDQDGDLDRIKALRLAGGGNFQGALQADDVIGQRCAPARPFRGP